MPTRRGAGARRRARSTSGTDAGLASTQYAVYTVIVPAEAFSHLLRANITALIAHLELLRAQMVLANILYPASERQEYIDLADQTFCFPDLVWLFSGGTRTERRRAKVAYRLEKKTIAGLQALNLEES